MRLSKRKSILRLLGDAGIRDFKSEFEMGQAKSLWDLMVRNDQEEAKQQELPLAEGSPMTQLVKKGVETVKKIAEHQKATHTT